GAVMYQMLTGANPFAAPTLSETIRRIDAGEYPPLTLARPDTPTPLRELIDRLLATRPDDRIQSAGDLVEALIAHRYTQGERFGAADLATLLAPLREGQLEAIEIETTDVLDEPSTAADKTPVEVPSRSSRPPPPSVVSATHDGERREVSLLVVALGSPRGPGAPDDLIRRMRAVLERHGAWLEKVSTSEIVAIFGLGDTDGRDAEAAVRAAMVLVRERSQGIVPSVGVHSGSISVDDGGLPLADNRITSLLATTQTLARATEGQVVLSNTAGRLVRRAFVTEPLETSARVVVEGGLVVRRALDREGERSRFVGRADALKRLGAILASATRKGAQIVVVRGETGLGKSRLLTEAKRRLERGRFNVAFYSVSCPLNGASMPWSGMRAMLHVLCGTQDEDDSDRILEVRPRLRALGLNSEQAGSILKLLGARVGEQGESERRALMRSSFERMVRSLCRDRLHCFAWDDAQAIDRETLEVLLRVLGRHRSVTKLDPITGKLIVRRGLQAVFILAMRGEIPPALAKRKDLNVLDLDELDERHTRKLIEAHLGARSIPDQLLSYVRQAAGGHPLFVDELLRELCDGGAIQVLNGNIIIKEDTQASAPRTLRTLIADRVSRLQQRERQVLQGLAILGEPALTPMLANLVDQSLPILDLNLALLETKGLVRRTGPTKVRFASPLYLEIVRDAMPTGDHSRLHVRAAKAYETAQLTGPGEAEERMAEHLLSAGKRDEAVTAFWRSARDRLAADQFESGLASMLRGLDVVDASARSVDELGSWLADVADTVSRVRKAPGLGAAINPILRQIRSRGTPRERALAQIHAAKALGSVNLFDEAYEALAAAGAIDVTEVEVQRKSLIVEAQLAMRQGLFRRTIAAGERLEALGGEEDSETLTTIALATAMGGDPAQALLLLRRIEALGPPKDALEAVLRQKHLVLILMANDEIQAAARECTELAALARAAGLRFDTAAALHNLGDLYDRLGDHPRAYAAFVESLELTQLLDHQRLTNLNRMHLCLLDGLRSPDGAAERLRSFIRYADGHGYLWDVLEGRYLLARLDATHGHHKEARRGLEEVVTLARRDAHAIIERDATALLEKLGGEVPNDES
ncbi:MAG: AAA family ATPase, partial [Myxococcales bacterium]|nr:AAA family ATPase [Myxococcales bacterium]